MAEHIFLISEISEAPFPMYFRLSNYVIYRSSIHSVDSRKMVFVRTDVCFHGGTHFGFRFVRTRRL